jgi:hypothetical protein
MTAGRGETGVSVYALARTVTAAAGIGWAWSADELEGLVTAFGWIYRAPSEGSVSCTFDAAPGRAGAFLFGPEVTAVYLNLSETDDAGVPERRDAFVAAIAEVSAQLGPPSALRPGPDPSVGWRVAAGVLEIVDRPGVLDLWLRPAPRSVPHPPVPPVRGESGWAALEASLAAAVASLTAGAAARLATGAGTVAELRQTEDCLMMHAAGGTERIRWPAAGETYRRIASGLVTRLRDEAGSPAEIAFHHER